jgi:hypothetical protein
MPLPRLGAPCALSLITLAALVLCCRAEAARAQPPAPCVPPQPEWPNRQSPAEVWVFDKVRCMVEADLSKAPEATVRPAERVISASFLKQLLTMSAGPRSLPDSISIANATISGPLEMRNANIFPEVRLRSCNFDAVDLSQSTFHKNLDLQGSSFKGDFNFSDHATVANSLSIKQAKFLKADSVADFSGVKIGGSLLMQQAVFEGGARFKLAQVGGHLDGFAASFKSQSQVADFESMNVKHDVIFRGGDPPRFPCTLFAGPARFTAAVVGGMFEAHNTCFRNTDSPPRFDDMKAGSIRFGRPETFAGQPVIDGMTYENIEIFFASSDPASDQEKHRRLIAFLEKAKFSGDAYAKLEKYLRDKGDAAMADEVAASRARRKLAGKGWPSKLLYVLGQQVWLIPAVCLGVVTFGYFVFRRREGMRPRETGGAARPYSPIWYTLDLFIPAIDLKTADHWEPRYNRQFARHYVQIQRILGWLLLPLLGVAILGWFKGL